jgi:hypothetical protein
MKMDQAKMSVAAAEDAVVVAQAALTQAEKTAVGCEPEQALGCRDAVTVAHARLRKAEQAATAARAALQLAEAEERDAVVRKALPLASHDKFVRDVTPLAKKLLDIRRQLGDTLATVDRVVADQNKAAETCGALLLTAGHARAHVLAVMTRDGAGPVNVGWLQPVEVSELWAPVMSLYGQNPAVRPMNMNNEELVDRVLRGEDVNKIVEKQAAQFGEAAKGYMSEKQRQYEEEENQNALKSSGKWWQPGSWFAAGTE